MASNARDDGSASTKTGLHRNVRLLGWASLLNDVASEAIFPLLPQFVRSLGGGAWVLGFLEGMSDTVASLLKLGAGTWSDRLGSRRGFVIVGYAMAGFARPVLAIATQVWHVFAVRLVDRVGKGLRTAPRDAMIAESTEEHQRGRAFGYHRAMDHLGAAIGPLLAALFLWIVPEGLRWLMLLTLVPGLIVLGLQVFGLKESARPHAIPQAARQTTQQTTALLELPRGQFRLYLIALLIFTLANSSDAFLLLRASELGVETAILPLLWSVLHVLKSFGNRWLGPWSDVVSPVRLILAGWAVYAATYLGFGWADRAWHVWLLFLVYALFYALTEPAEKKLVTRFAADTRAGAAFGWFHTILGLANLPASLAFGWIYEAYGPRAAFAWSVALTFAAMATLARLRLPAS